MQRMFKQRKPIKMTRVATGGLSGKKAWGRKKGR